MAFNEVSGDVCMYVYIYICIYMVLSCFVKITKVGSV
jgi:hypothetical protein